MLYNNFGVSNTERGVLRASSGSPHLTGTLQASLLPALGTSRLLINDTDLLQRWQQIAVDGRDRNDCMKEMMSSFPGPVQLEYIKLIIEYTLLQREQYGDLLVASYDWYETQNLYRHFPEGQQHVNALSNELGEDFLTTVKAARLEVSDRAAAVRAIEKRWEMPFSTAIPEEFRPGTVGRHFAKAFNKLTKYCTLEEAWGKDSKDGLLQPIIRARIEGGTRGAFRLSLTLKDLETALSQMNPEASTDTRMVLRNLPDKSALMKHSTTTAKRPWSGRSNKTSSKKSRGLIQSEQNTVTDEESLDTCIVATPASAKPQSGGLASESPTLAVPTALDAAANDGNGLQGPRKTGDAELDETSPGSGLDVDIHHPENMALTNSQGLLAGIEADPQKSSLAADADSNTVNATRLTSGALQSQDSGNNMNLDTVTPNVPSCPDSETGRPGAAKPGKLPELIAETVAGSNLLPHQSKQSPYSQLEARYQADRDKVVNEANSAAPDRRVEISDDNSENVSDSDAGDGQGYEEEDQHPNNHPRIAEKKPTLSLRSPKNPQETSYTGQSLVQKTLVSSLLSDFRDWLSHFHELFDVEIETFIAWCRTTPGAYGEAFNDREGTQLFNFSVMQQFLAQDSTVYAMTLSQHARKHNVAWKVISNLCYPFLIPQASSELKTSSALKIPPYDGGPVYYAAYHHRVKSSGDEWVFPIEYLIQADLDNNPLIPAADMKDLTFSHVTRRMPECQLNTKKAFNGNGDHPIYDPLIRFPPCTAIGEALLGMRAWDNPLVRRELSQIWGQPGSDLDYVRRIMEKTLEGYIACTQFLVPSGWNELPRDRSSSEAETSMSSAVQVPSNASRASSSETAIKPPTSPESDVGDAMDTIATGDSLGRVDNLSTVENDEEDSETTLGVKANKMMADKAPIPKSQVPRGWRKGYDDPPLAPGLSRGWRKPPFWGPASLPEGFEWPDSSIPCWNHSYYDAWLKGNEWTVADADRDPSQDHNRYTIESLDGPYTIDDAVWYLVKWEGYPLAKDITWEPRSELLEQIPTVLLELERALFDRIGASMGLFAERHSTS